MKDLSGKYRHEKFSQIWKIQRMGGGGDLYAVSTYSLADELNRLGPPIHLLALDLKDLIENNELVRINSDKNILTRIFEKLSGK